jgi:hypothetical protein
MGDQHFVPEPRWVLSPHRRRLTIGDVMVVIALAAIGFSTVALPAPSIREKQFLGTFNLGFLGLLFAQWGIAGIPGRRSGPAVHVFLGVLSCSMSLFMFVSLVVLGLIIPQGAAFIGVEALLLVVYLTTWNSCFVTTKKSGWRIRSKRRCCMAQGGVPCRRNTSCD